MNRNRERDETHEKSNQNTDIWWKIRNIIKNFNDILQDKWISIWNFVNLMRSEKEIDLHIFCHWINYPIKSKLDIWWIDMASSIIEMSSFGHIPKILHKSSHKWVISIDNVLIEWHAKVWLNDKISFRLENISSDNFIKAREHRRIVFTSKERMLCKRWVDWHHISQIEVKVWDKHKWIIHDLSLWWAWIFVYGWNDFLDAMMDTNWETMAIDVDFFFNQQTVNTKMKLLNLREVCNENSIYRIWWQFIWVWPKTEDILYKIMLDAERIALQKIRHQSD